MKQALTRLLADLQEECAWAAEEQALNGQGLARTVVDRIGFRVRSIELDVAVDKFIAEHIMPLQEYKAMYDGLCK